MEGLIVDIAPWCDLQEAGATRHQGDQGFRNQGHGMDHRACSRYSDGAGNDEEVLTDFFRVPLTSVSILNSTRRCGRLVLRAFHTDFVSASAVREMTRKMLLSACTATFRRSMSRVQRVWLLPLLRTHRGFLRFCAWHGLGGVAFLLRIKLYE